MKEKSCMAIAIVLLVLSVITASSVMAGTLKYAPTPQELPQGFYYTSIETGSPQILDDLQKDCGVRPIYGESVEFYSETESAGGGIGIIEFSNVEDAKKGYLCWITEFSDLHITEIDAFGDESISGYESDDFLTIFRNDAFIAYVGTNDLDELNKSKSVITYILPKKIDGKLELIKAPTPTPTPSIPAFKIIPAIATLLAVAYLIIRRGRY